MIVTRRLLLAVFALTLTLGWPIKATADGAPDGISVIATGSVFSPPDRIEMAVSVTGSAQLAGEAATKFRGQRDRLNEALESLGIEGMKTRGGKVAVNGSSGTMRNEYGQMVPNTKGTFTLRETITIDMPASENTLDVVARIYDIGKDLGIQFVNPATGGGSLVGAKFVKAEEAKKAAYKQAMDEARKQAETLAELAGRELGQVASVTVTNVNTVSSPASHQHSGGMQQVFMNGVVSWVSTDQMTGAAVSEDASITQQKTTVSLNVRFDLK